MNLIFCNPFIIQFILFYHSDQLGGLQASEIETNYDTVFESFDDMNLKEPLLRGIFGYGFERPSAIQARAIVPITTARDVIAKLNLVPVNCHLCHWYLAKIDHTRKECQALILAPTRELAQQIQGVVLALGDKLGISCHACVGGTNVREDMAILEAGVHVVVGTPVVFMT